MSWLNPASWIMSAVKGLAGVVANVIIQRGNTEAARQADQNASGVTLAANYLNAHAEANRAKLAYRPIWFVLFGLFMFALPVGIHWWAVMLDSMPFYIPGLMDAPHKVGAWKVAAGWKGEWIATYHKIIDSFFIAAPATAGIALLARAFMR
jgi:hypothetical protein